MDDWQDLKFLLALVERGSLPAAAEALDVNRTTVSRRIASLEQRLGVKLVQKVGRSLVPTDAGFETLEVAERVAGEMRGLERRLAGRDEGLSGIVRLAMTPAVAPLIAGDLALLSDRHPDLVLEVSTSYQTENLELMEADIALRLTDDPPPDLVGRKIAEPKLAVYAGRETLLARGASEISYVAGGQVGFGIDEWIRETYDAQPRMVLRTDSMALQMAMVARGVGIAMLPCYVAAANEQLVRVSEPLRGDMPALWLLYHPRQRRMRRIRVVADSLIESAGKLRAVFEGGESL